MARGLDATARLDVDGTRRHGILFSNPLLCPVLALIGLYMFSTAFFLAKRSMPHVSSCDRNSASHLLHDWLGLTGAEIRSLRRDGILSSGDDNEGGCWMTRRVDSMVVIVVDALRFDFARHHLPLSLGSRLQESKSNATLQGRSQLLKFVADPPTVTMQRLKGLTTGGLPTFADISDSFGGATVDEDTWVQQLKDTPPSRRGLNFHGRFRTKLAFVGDDTWVDLFPTQFDDCHPFPSFNTRDLDSVDNGCLQHLPRLMQSLGPKNAYGDRRHNGFEVVVAHFLGVDHVGHTYGPHNSHMDQKLRQMDNALGAVLDSIDDASSHECQVAFIFGDHGMTEDGNHGGGTEEEINAALFAHFSSGCGDMIISQDVAGTEVGIHSEEAFQSIHQIDLVPTISILLGLPIPYANLGGLVPSLLPPLIEQDSQTPLVAAALALNSAQVWRFFNVYSKTANALPSLPELELLLQDAVSVYKEALSREDAQDSIAYREACGKFKLFLAEASDLGKRVWTRFDVVGMSMGASVLFVAVLLGVPTWPAGIRVRSLYALLNHAQFLEVMISLVLMVFQCVILTFSNSYIEAERNVTMFSLAVICIAISCRRSVVSDEASAKDARYGQSKENTKTIPLLSSPWLPLAIPVCARASELLVTGHGMDPAIRLHVAHHSAVFLSSLALLVTIRWQLFRRQITSSANHTLADIGSLICLALCWWEKRAQDPSRNGYFFCRAALLLLVSGMVLFLIEVCFFNGKNKAALDNEKWIKSNVLTLSFKLLFINMAVTGPSTSTYAVLFIVATVMLYAITKTHREQQVSSPVAAALWRLTIRHAFFATGHACGFNKLQYSAAFVATSEFYFVTGGISLFLNTFGWEILGSILVLAASILTHRRGIWEWFYMYQLLETFGACVSVSLMRRHLMVWAIFAPRFVFAAIFLVLGTLARITVLALSKRP